MTGRAGAAGFYAELHCHSHYSFLDGADSPALLVEEAGRLGLAGLAITDHDGLYAAPSFATTASAVGLPTVFGAELNLDLPGPRAGMADPGGTHLLVLARDPAGYRRLSAAIARAHLSGDEKGRPVYNVEELARAADGHWEILTGCRKSAVPRALGRGGVEAAAAELRRLVDLFGAEHVHVELTCHRQPLDDERNDALARLADRFALPVLATGNVHYARPSGFATFAALTALRARRSVQEMDPYLPAGPGAFLRGPAEMAQLFAHHPGAVDHAAALAAQCTIDFDKQIKARPPRFPVPAGHTEDSYLREVAFAGLERRYGTRLARPDAYAQAEHELAVIKQVGFAGFFLVSWDIVRFARAQDPPILVQGRGSAANSVIVHALGISAVDPIRYKLLFSRFLNPDRDGPPDIDIDIQADRREEVIQYVYGKYGRYNAAMVANEVTLKPRFALREAARALGYSPGAADAFAKRIDGHGPLPEADEHLPDPVIELARRLSAGRPRHLSIHSGGMVLADRPISEVLPVEWARMQGRSIVQGDKESINDAGLYKHDLLSLRALDVVADAFAHLSGPGGDRIELADMPADDPAVFDMICDGDTVGVFQIESRAQQVTAPVMQARTFHDLAVQIALIRPGPGGSGASRRYLRRRRGKDPVPPIHPVVDEILRTSLGTVLFQEQAMSIAIEAAGFTPGEADRLRRAMGAKRSAEKMAVLRRRFLTGLAQSGITGGAAEDLYTQIESFSGYGFPESHALSFAYIALAMAWIKLYHPALLLAGLLNHQPMGFYEPPTLIEDAIRHHVPIRPVCINASNTDAHLEPLTNDLIAAYRPTHRHASPHPQPPVRLGLAGVRGLGPDTAERIVAHRAADGPYTDVEDLVRRTELPLQVLESLAMSGALDCFGLPRRETLWAAGAAAHIRPGHLPGTTPGTTPPTLPLQGAQERTIGELWAGQHAATHPMLLIRQHLTATGITPASGLKTLRHGQPVRVAGLVTHRQRPPTAHGVCFLGLEDETGLINVVVPAKTWNTQKRRVQDAGALIIHGVVESEDGSISILAGHLTAMTVAATDRSRNYR